MLGKEEKYTVDVKRMSPDSSLIFVKKLELRLHLEF